MCRIVLNCPSFYNDVAKRTQLLIDGFNNIIRSCLFLRVLLSAACSPRLSLEAIQRQQIFCISPTPSLAKKKYGIVGTGSAWVARRIEQRGKACKGGILALFNATLLKSERIPTACTRCTGRYALFSFKYVRANSSSDNTERHAANTGGH